MIDEKWLNATAEDVLLALVSKICQYNAQNCQEWLEVFLTQNEPDFDAIEIGRAHV